MPANRRSAVDQGSHAYISTVNTYIDIAISIVRMRAHAYACIDLELDFHVDIDYESDPELKSTRIRLYHSASTSSQLAIEHMKIRVRQLEHMKIRTSSLVPYAWPVRARARAAQYTGKFMSIPPACACIDRHAVIVH